MRSVNKLVALLLVLGLVFGMGPAGALAAASAEPSGSFVLPAGQQLEDDDLAEVTGGILPYVVGAVVGYVGGKLADKAWDRYVDPWLEDKFWPWVDEKLGF